MLTVKTRFHHRNKPRPPRCDGVPPIAHESPVYPKSVLSIASRSLEKVFNLAEFEIMTLGSGTVAPAHDVLSLSTILAFSSSFLNYRPFHEAM